LALGVGDAAPTYVGSITLASGDNWAAGGVLDASDPLHHYAYFGCATSPGRVKKSTSTVSPKSARSRCRPVSRGRAAPRRGRSHQSLCVFCDDQQPHNPRV